MGYRIQSISQTLTSPAAVASYGVGQLIGNSSLASACTPLTFQVGSNFRLTDVNVVSSSTAIVGASFKVHLYGASPTVVNSGSSVGNGGAWQTTVSNYIDSVTVPCSVNTFSSLGVATAGLSGHGYYTASNLASSFPTPLTIPYNTIYALVVTNASCYVPVASQTYTVTLNGEVRW